MTENKIKTGAGDGGPFFRFIRLFHFIRLVLSGSFYLARFIWLGALSAAPGYRNRADGVQRGVGNEGTVWSASVPDGSTNAWRLLFNATGMYPSYASGRGGGFQLRCLSE
ncbi:hypothetical protein [uncultured Rikenella sp.]|uniref:hypothetical protein n=1 Tax=uncultured Rikenella sp. TaxID=368003 RepID=UPI0026297C9F|nr:hypothetical protein [uncultured Rikenella sp.]